MNNKFVLVRADWQQLRGLGGCQPAGGGDPDGVPARGDPLASRGPASSSEDTDPAAAPHLGLTGNQSPALKLEPPTVLPLEAGSGTTGRRYQGQMWTLSVVERTLAAASQVGEPAMVEASELREQHLGNLPSVYRRTKMDGNRRGKQRSQGQIKSTWT